MQLLFPIHACTYFRVALIRPCPEVMAGVFGRKKSGGLWDTRKRQNHKTIKQLQNLRRELAAIKGSSPPVLHHSLLAESDTQHLTHLTHTPRVRGAPAGRGTEDWWKDSSIPRVSVVSQRQNLPGICGSVLAQLNQLAEIYAQGRYIYIYYMLYRLYILYNTNYILWTHHILYIDAII